MTNLKRMLKRKKFKAVDLAKHTRVAPCTVSLHSINGVKTIRIAKRYARVLGCSPFDLMDI